MDKLVYSAVSAHAGNSPAIGHLQDAALHLRRATLAIKSAAAADPRLLVALGTKHAALIEVLRELEGQPHG